MKNNPYDRPNTSKAYASLYKHWIEGRTSDEIFDLLLNIETHIKPRTKLAVLRVLKRTNPELFKEPRFNHLVKVLSKMQPTNQIQVLTKEQASKAMGVCEKVYPEFYPILLLALHGGLRRGEVFGLKWKDIDFINNRVFIHNSYDGPTKSGKSRKIPMSKELEKSLMRRYNLTEGENSKLFPVINPNPILEDICKRAKIPHVTFHQLRHTFATLALESGMSPKQVQTLLGHSKVSVTLDLYWQNIHEETDLSFLP